MVESVSWLDEGVISKFCLPKIVPYSSFGLVQLSSFLSKFLEDSYGWSMFSSIRVEIHMNVPTQSMILPLNPGNANIHLVQCCLESYCHSSLRRIETKINVYVHLCVRSPHSACFILSFIFLSFEYICLRLDLALYVKKYTSFYPMLFFWLINCIWRWSLTPCSKEQTWWLSVLLALECSHLSHLLTNLQYHFLFPIGKGRNSYQGSPQGSGGGQASQRDPELYAFKRGRTGRQAHIFFFFLVLVCMLKIMLS